MMCGLENFQVNGVNIIQTTFNQTTTHVLGSQKGRLNETFDSWTTKTYDVWLLKFPLQVKWVNINQTSR